MLSQNPLTLIPPPIGRFAPSPTGRLHQGSLISALASFCHIKSLGGQWLLRIEDTDSQRCHPSFANSILRDLDNLGLHWDGLSYQSKRLEIYQHHLTHLRPLLYACHCSRKSLGNAAIYPRHCLPTAASIAPLPAKTKIRLMLPNTHTVFFDGLQGLQWQNPQKLLGDSVVRRADGIINYILAAGIDDGLQQISHVMRGMDILPMTAAQLFIQKSLNIASPSYFYHLPLLINQHGQKLSKQTLAAPIDSNQPQKLLIHTLKLLRQPTDDLHGLTTDKILVQACRRWNHHTLRHITTLQSN